MYDKNLFYWFKTELDGIVDSTIDKGKITTDDRFFKVFANKKAKILRDYDFTELTIPKQYLNLTEQQKESIKQLLTIWNENMFYEDYLRLICRVGYCYEKAGLESSPEYNAILPNYQFLKELWQQAYPIEFNESQSQKQTIHTYSQHPQQVRPNCPACQSTDIVSNGLCWFCKSCAKQWLKNPKRKPNNT
ncbi:MAG: hypothetical protein NWE98_06250 [Candidatus Bathyarchaeota archaeon]|nr:hypothetical protein [Candidatus Bathyarchaeota archaeon]